MIASYEDSENINVEENLWAYKIIANLFLTFYAANIHKKRIRNYCDMVHRMLFILTIIAWSFHVGMRYGCDDKLCEINGILGVFFCN